MPFTFDRFAVVVAFHFDNPDDLNGTEQELANFDTFLSQRYGGFLAAALSKHGLPDNNEVRSMVALLAKLSSGSPKSQVSNACEYYASTRPALPGPIVAGGEPGARRRGAKRGTRRARGKTPRRAPS